MNDENEINNFGGGIYCTDFYKYLKFNVRKYDSISKMEVQPKFSYHNLDLMKKTTPLKILTKTDQDEIYQIYDKVYIETFDKSKHNIADFYIWLIENKCHLVEMYVNKMSRLFIID